MELEKVASEIREIISQKQNELGLSFIEDQHIYYMKDTDGEMRSNYPSVSKVLKKFYVEFPKDEIAEKKAKGVPVVKEQLIK